MVGGNRSSRPSNTYPHHQEKDLTNSIVAWFLGNRSSKQSIYSVNVKFWQFFYPCLNILCYQPYSLLRNSVIIQGLRWALYNNPKGVGMFSCSHLMKETNPLSETSRNFKRWTVSKIVTFIEIVSSSYILWWKIVLFRLWTFSTCSSHMGTHSYHHQAAMMNCIMNWFVCIKFLTTSTQWVCTWCFKFSVLDFIKLTFL